MRRQVFPQEADPQKNIQSFVRRADGVLDSQQGRALHSRHMRDILRPVRRRLLQADPYSMSRRAPRRLEKLWTQPPLHSCNSERRSASVCEIRGLPHRSAF